MMRFQLNLAAVVRNVAVLANVALLPVVQLVAGYHKAHEAMISFGQKTGFLISRFAGLTRPGRPWLWCDSSLRAMVELHSMIGGGAILVPVTVEDRCRQQTQILLSKRQHDHVMSADWSRS